MGNNPVISCNQLSKKKDSFPGKVKLRLFQSSITESTIPSLFNFHKEYKLMKEQEIKRTSNFAISGGEIKLLKKTPVPIKEDNSKKYEESVDMWLSYKENAFNLTYRTLGSSTNSLWLVLRKMDINNKNKHKIIGGDMIRIGKCKFLVRETCVKSINNQEEILTTKNNNENNEASQISALCLTLINEKLENEGNANSASKNDEQLSKMCKICMSNDFQADNPLISPCACAGSMKYVHLKCLQTWMKSNVEQKITDCVWTFNCKIMKCEICKQRLNTEISHKDKNFYLLPYSQPENESYITLQSISDEEGEAGKIYVIIMQNKKPSTIGRFIDCEMKLNEISVSRKHASVTMEADEFFIEDMGSKYGTLILLNPNLHKSINFSLDMGNICFQYGATLLTVDLSKKIQQKAEKLI